MRINNFKRLHEEEEELYLKKYDEKIRGNLFQSLSMFRLVGQIVEMYLPKMFEMIVVAAGGRLDDKPKHTGTAPPSEMQDTRNGKRAPGDSLQDDISRI